VAIQHGSVSHLPFPDDSFDLVTAVETHYYWPEPVADMREILRVLKPGGRLVVIAETYRGETLGRLLLLPMKLIRARYLTAREHQELFAEAGLVDVAIHLERRKGWICGVGVKGENRR
jgi:SAM-dependent methyltransferase